MNLDYLENFLRIRLQSELPGREVQLRMAVSAKQFYTSAHSEKNAVPAAVLILLHEHQNRTCFYLTERSEFVEHHRGQISLPGGVQENNENLLDTALRETEEELGIPVKHIKVLGTLTPLFVLVSGFKIHPFIGILTSRIKMKPAHMEVAEVFSAQINELLDEHNLKKESRNIRGLDVMVPYFQLNNHKVWGATSMILSEFKVILSEGMKVHE